MTIKDSDSLTKLRILVVDDNEASAKTSGWTMEMFGHDVKVELNALKAVAAAEEYKPDVIFLDIGLPGMDGYQLCQALRQKPEFSKIPIIAQTGWDTAEKRQLSIEAGFDHHLVKPVDPMKLEELLASFTK